MNRTTIRAVFTHEPKAISIAGVYYPSIRAAAREFGIENKSIGLAMQHYSPEAQIIRLLSNKYLMTRCKDRTLIEEVNRISSWILSQHPQQEENKKSFVDTKAIGSIMSIIAETAAAHGLKLSVITGRDRHKRISIARAKAAAAAADAGFTHEQIAEVLNRDRSSLSYLVRVGREIREKEDQHERGSEIRPRQTPSNAPPATGKRQAA